MASISYNVPYYVEQTPNEVGGIPNDYVSSGNITVADYATIIPMKNIEFTTVIVAIDYMKSGKWLLSFKSIPVIKERVGMRSIM